MKLPAGTNTALITASRGVNLDFLNQAMQPKPPTIERAPLVAPHEPVMFIEPVIIETPNPLNGSHGSHFKVAARGKKQVEATQAALFGRFNYKPLLAPGCTVTLTRCSSGTLASDALPGALKHIRDAVAQWLLGGEIGRMDDDPRLTWVYKQMKIKRGVPHSVLVGLETRRAS